MSNTLYYLSLATVYALLWCCCMVFVNSLKHREHYVARVLAGSAGWAFWSWLAIIVQGKSGFQSVVWMINGGLLCVCFLWLTCRERKSTILYCGIWIMLATQMIVQLWDLVWLLSGQFYIWRFLSVWGIACVVLLRYTLVKWLPGSGGYDVGPRKLLLSGVTFFAFQVCVISMERDGFYDILLAEHQ